MKHICKMLLSIFLIPGAMTYAQVKTSTDLSYTVGEPYGVVDAKKKYYFHKGDEILMVKIDGKSIILQKFNAKTLRFIKIKVHEDMPKGYSLENVTQFNESFYLFYSLWDKPNEKEQLFYRKIDFENCSFAGVGKPIVKVDGKITGRMSTSSGFFGGLPTGVTDKFGFNISYDKSKMLVQYRKKPENKKDSENYDMIGLFVFDEKMEKAWGEEVRMPYTEEKMDNLDYSIDAGGNAYILSTVKDAKGGAKAKYHIELLRIEANSTAVEKTKVAMGTKFINSVLLYESPGDYMVGAGFYNDGADLDDADGVFLFKVGKQGGIYDAASYEIPVKVLNQYVSKKTKKKTEKKAEDDKAEFQELELSQVVIGDDGSLLLIGEQHFILAHTTYSNGKSRTYYTYHYNDMLVTKIDGNGKLAWMQKLPKRQTGKDGRGGMSFKYIDGGGNHYLLFLDNVKNMDLPLDEVPANHSDGAGGFLTAYKITDSNGEVSKISIFDTRDVKGTEVFQFNTDRIFSVAPDQFAVEVYKKNKEDVMIKITVNK